jgi:hydrogenase expression/formation protein HypC
MCLAVPGEIVSIAEGDALCRMARVSFGGVVRSVSLACVPEATAGQYVIVHAGVALSILDEEAAEETLAYFAGMASLAAGDEGAP